MPRFCGHFCKVFFSSSSGSSSPFLFFSRLNLAVKSEFLSCDFSSPPAPFTGDGWDQTDQTSALSQGGLGKRKSQMGKAW